MDWYQITPGLSIYSSHFKYKHIAKIYKKCSQQALEMDFCDPYLADRGPLTDNSPSIGDEELNVQPYTEKIQ